MPWNKLSSDLNSPEAPETLVSFLAEGPSSKELKKSSLNSSSITGDVPLTCLRFRKLILLRSTPVMMGILKEKLVIYM